MTQLFKRLLNIAYVEQKNDVIQIGGVVTQSLVKDIQATWGSSKIHSNMFSDFGRKYLEFNVFFALEVHYMLNRLLKNRRNWTSRNTLLSVIRQLEENTWLANMNDEKEHPKIFDRSKLSLFFKTPLPHQSEFFDTYEYGRARLGLRGFLLSAAAGSGKTLSNLMLAEMVHSDYVIIVSPNNAVYRVWDAAVCGDEKREYKEKQARWIAGENKPYNKERFLITHFEGLEKLTTAARGLSGKVTIILDESHNFNNLTSDRTQLFVDLCASTKSENVIWSSGTPIKALGGECIPLLKTIDPLFTPKVAEVFKQIFGINAQRALDILRHRMSHIKFDVEKSAVQTEKPIEEELRVSLPNGNEYTLDAIRTKMADFIAARMEYYKTNYKLYEEIYLRGVATYESKITTSEQKERLKLYRRCVEVVKKNPDPRYTGDEMKVCNEFEVSEIMPALDLEHRKSFKGAKSVIKYVNLKVMGEALGGVLGRARARLHVEMLDQIDFAELLKKAEKKTVVFTSYVEVVKASERIFQTLGMKPMLVYADTNKNLSGNIAAFEKDPNVNPTIATFNSLSTAVPLVMADLSIFLNVPFRDHELVQAKARTDRLGQDTQVKYVMVYLDTGKVPNISTRSKEILEWSREQVALILGKDYNGEAAKTLESYIGSLESDQSDTLHLEFEEALNEVLEYPLY